LRLERREAGGSLLAGGGAFGLGGGGSGVGEGADVAGNAFEEAFGDALFVVGLAELRGVSGVGDEGDLGEDGGHIGADKDDEGSFFDASVFERAATADTGSTAGAEAGASVFGGTGETGIERGFDVGGELAGLGKFVFEGDLSDEVRELRDGLAGDSVFAGGNFEGVGLLGEVEVVGFDAAGGGIGRGVGVDGEEEVGLGLVGDGGAGLKRDKGIVGAGVDDLGAELLVEQRTEAEGDVEDDIFFLQAVDAEGSGVVAAVAGVDDDAVDFEAEGADERGLAGGGLELGGASRGGGVADGMGVGGGDGLASLPAGFLCGDYGAGGGGGVGVANDAGVGGGRACSRRCD